MCALAITKQNKTKRKTKQIPKPNQTKPNNPTQGEKQRREEEEGEKK
jgi:hypothetical protein|tara:strand:+ start:539 stop:679 length:141 start_codon:yes stop_codon:yes gene_type:complete